MMAAAQFKLNFQQLRGSLIKTVVAEYEISSELTALADIKDFEKYAGLDYGAVYIPRVEALRQFFTINIYLGAVEDKPTGMTEVVDENGNKKKSSRAEWLRQRFSLTFGMSIGDISSQDSSKIKGDNVFLYGIGFRLNKYFRLTTGAAVFRDARNDRLSHGLMLGPSVDLTAFRYIRGLFGKASSRD
jgi:hypothetical protein